MNIAIIYYSYSGNTAKVAGVIAEILQAENHSVTMLRVEAPRESNNFFIQCLRAATKQKTEIMPLETDLSRYDLIIFAAGLGAGNGSANAQLFAKS